jgi:hypothetical protein
VIIGWQRRSDMLALGVAKLRGSAPPCPLGVVPTGQVVCWARSARQKPRFTGEGCRGVAHSVHAEMRAACAQPLKGRPCQGPVEWGPRAARLKGSV